MQEIKRWYDDPPTQRQRAIPKKTGKVPGKKKHWFPKSHTARSNILIEPEAKDTHLRGSVRGNHKVTPTWIYPPFFSGSPKQKYGWMGPEDNQ